MLFDVLTDLLGNLLTGLAVGVLQQHDKFLTAPTADDVGVAQATLQIAGEANQHLVTGHVDGIGTITTLKEVGECWLLKIRAPHAISKYVAKKGSLCVNGISLTVNEISQDEVSINLIPHTMQHTMMQYAKAGDPVNLEIDLIARYVERMQAWEQE